MLDYRPIDIEYVVLLNFDGPCNELDVYRERWNVINISTKEQGILTLIPGEDKVIHEALDYSQ